jgi:hypothetical protein
MAQRRAGRTVKVSVSLDQKDLATLKLHARTACNGNLSAAVSDAARLLRQRYARDRVIAMLGGSSLTGADVEAIRAEQEGEPRKRPKRTGRRKAA